MRVKVVADPEPQFCRIIMAGDWRGNPEEAGDVLEAVAGVLGDLKKKMGFGELFTVTTCGGFLVQHWEDYGVDGHHILRMWRKTKNPETYWTALEDAAKDVASSISFQVRRLLEYASNVTFGADFMYEWAKCELGRATPGRLYEGPHAELVVVWSRDGTYVTGKSFPTDAQKAWLVPAPLRTHLMELSWGGREMTSLVLGCHDLNVFSPRAWALVKGYKRRAVEYFKELAQTTAVDALLHHPHMTDTWRIWGTALVGIRRLMPDLGLFVSAGRYARPCGLPPRGELKETLRRMKKGRSVDIIVYS